jgi:uncharacterized protein with PIN domain
MEGMMPNNDITNTVSFTGWHTSKKQPSTTRCPYCGCDLVKIVAGLKSNPNSKEFSDAYTHIHFECLSCKHEISEKYVNAYGNWNNKEV